MRFVISFPIFNVFIIWLARWVGKMNEIRFCDWQNVTVSRKMMMMMMMTVILINDNSKNLW